METGYRALFDGDSSSIHARYGDWLMPDLKRAIETNPDPLADEENNPLADAAE